MYTINPIVGEIAMPPRLPPQTVWRHQISPTVGPFMFSVPLVDYDGRFRTSHPDDPDFATAVKTVLTDGDEFVATCSDGSAIKLTVGAPIPPGGNP